MSSTQQPADQQQQPDEAAAAQAPHAHSHAHSYQHGQQQQQQQAPPAQPELLVTDEDRQSVERGEMAFEELFAKSVRAEFDRADAGARAQIRPPAYPPGQSQHFLREVFFAGFPCLQPHPASFQHVAGGANAARDNAVYSVACVQKLFAQFGTLDHFGYDMSRGMGWAAYNRGEDAESCFLSMNNAVIPGTLGDPSIKGLQQVNEIGYCSFEKDSVADPEAAKKAKDHIITCEFGRCLPFVTSFLLLKDEFDSLDLSRSLLRNFPVPDNAASGRLGAWPIAAFHEFNQIVETHPDGKPVKPEERATATGTIKHAKPVQMFMAPILPETDQEIGNPLPGVAFRLLGPSQAPGRGSGRITVVDLWWQYYNRYIIHKTEPSVDRIKCKRDFLMATNPTPAQEAISLSKDYWVKGASVDSASPSGLLRRLAFDDVYHCTLNAIIMRQKFRLDPAFVSFMRDVYSYATGALYSTYRLARPFDPTEALTIRSWTLAQKKIAEADRGNETGAFAAARRELAAVQAAAAVSSRSGEGKKQQQQDGDEEGEKEKEKDGQAVAATAAAAAAGKAALRADIAYSLDAQVQEWLSMPLLEVAANVIENVRFLRKVKKGLIGPDGAEEAEGAKHLRPEDDLGYPGMSVKQEDADLYDEVMTNINGFCADGSLFSLLIVGEAPATFRGEKAHLGWEENRRHHEKGMRNWGKDCADIAKALVVPVVGIACLAAFIMYLAGQAPAEDVTVATSWGKLEKRPTHDARGTVSVRAGNDTTDTTATTATITTEVEREEEKKGADGDAAASNRERQRAALAALAADPAKLAKRRRQIAEATRESMRKLKEEAEKRGAKFNIELATDL